MMMTLKAIIRYAVWLLAIWGMQANAADLNRASSPMQEYVLWVGSNAPGRADHEAETIRKALERTEASYGPFELVVSNDLSYSGKWRQLLAEGEEIQVVPTSLMDFPAGELTLIPVPIAGGKLGYRNLVVKKNRLNDFVNVKHAGQLTGFTAGQGSTWPDMWVYEANSLPIVGGHGMQNILQMLVDDEVDYVPLGVDETPAILNKYSELADQLAIVPDLLIYYPLSSFPVVSNKQPRLIARLREGLEAMHADGSLGETGRELFKYEKPENCRVITLENPSRLFPLL